MGQYPGESTVDPGDAASSAGCGVGPQHDGRDVPGGVFLDILSLSARSSQFFVYRIPASSGGCHHPNARSSSIATAMVTWSLPCLETTCTPRGRPVSLSPRGTWVAGRNRTFMIPRYDHGM